MLGYGFWGGVVGGLFCGGRVEDRLEQFFGSFLRIRSER